jgi:hypothetical protein
MRTEHDLTQALAARERYAPDPDTVLRAVRGGPRRAGRPRQRQLILPAAAAAAAALGLAIAVLPGSGSPHPAPSALPAAASVAKAMLAAFDSASGDVEYETQTGINHGATLNVYRVWSWPAQPAAGQRTIIRTLASGISASSSVLQPGGDYRVEFVTPPDNVDNADAQVTTVCFRAVIRCGFGDTDTPPGTWSRFTAHIRPGTDVSPGATFDPARLIKGIASGLWRVVGHTSLDGQPAIQLSETGHAFEPLPVTLWVDAQTYLPIRLVSGTADADTGEGVTDFSFLPPTAANLALLQVPIPPGYPQATPQR